MAGRPTWAEIDLSAIAANVRALCRAAKAGSMELMAVVKANGYGHGAVPVARAALDAGAGAIGVATPEEGRELREAGVDAPILVMGAFLPQQAPFFLHYGLTATVISWESARALGEAAKSQGTVARAHLKVDTGMGRLGVLYDEVGPLAARLEALPSLEIEGVFTHLATADEADTGFAIEQMRRFNGACEAVKAAGLRPRYAHAGNSAAVLSVPMRGCNLVRAGISLYGLYPSADVPRAVKLRPAMRLVSRIVSLKHVPAGTGVSYGSTYVTSRPTRLATIPVGYADGFSRILSGQVEVLHRGRRRPVVGRICMDQSVVDLADAEAKVGDEVVLLGRQGTDEIPAEEWAEKLGTINYEVVCAVSARVHRRYIGPGAA